MKSEQQAALRKPFPRESVGLLPRALKKDSPKSKCEKCGGYHGFPAIHLDYVGHAAVTDRLLQVDPEWTWEPVAFGPDGLPLIDGNGGLWIRLTVAGVTRLGYGHPDGKRGGDAIKEAIGDALRNAAMRFGVALDLWSKEELQNGVAKATTELDAPTPPPPPAKPSDNDKRRMFALASQKLGGPEEPFKAWLAAEVNYHGSRRDLNGAQVAWIIHKLAELPDHESETPNESR